VWDVQRPGRHIRDLVFSTRKGADGQSIKGIVSAVNYWNPDTILAGTYSKKIGMFDIRDKDKGMILGQFAKMGGIVQIESIPSRNAVVTNHRNDSYSIRIWDVRNPERPVQELSRNFSNHQRSSFGVFKDKFVVAGDIDGNLHVFDLISGECVMTRAVSPGTPTVSVDVNDFGKVAVGCGARVFDPVGDSSDESDGGNSPSYRVEFFNLS
jgi:WD40 repeat protein